MRNKGIAKLGFVFLCTNLLSTALAAPPEALAPAQNAASPVAGIHRQSNVRRAPGVAEADSRTAMNLSAVREERPTDDGTPDPDRGTPCQHRVDLYDSYGDGWTGNTLDVLVNGVVVLNRITLPNGPGPLSFYFDAATADAIQTIYRASGSYPFENSYKIYDGVGGLLVMDGVPGVQQPYGVTVAGNCEPPQTGACCYADGSCEMVASLDLCINGQFLGYGHTCLECTCTVECPPGSLPEPEPCGYDLNGGCNSPLQPFVDIQDGDTFYGSIWSSTYSRDTDWYRIVTTDSFTLTLSVEAEIPVTALILQAYPNYCNGPWTLAEATAGPCQPISITSDCRPAGEYWLWIGPPDNYQPWPCGNYAATINCTPCYIAHGACCFPNGHCTFVTYQNCYIAGGDWLGENVPCDECSPYYCDATGRWCDYPNEYISRVQIGTIDNRSGCDRYGDFLDLSTDLPYGSSTTLVVTNGAPFWANDYCAAWIDYNRDMSFDYDELLGIIPGTGPYEFAVTPPQSFQSGPTRMRVLIVFGNPNPQPCGTLAYGEVEDYTINLIEAPGACCDYSTQTCSLALPSACEGTYCGPYTTCAGADCNANGLDDFCDVFSGFSEDCDGNGVPDECQDYIDCNGNGIADFCDIASGRSLDCNENGIPDECDIASCPPEAPDCADCNANGILDGCEVFQHGNRVYQWDDGTHEEAIGLTNGGYTVWLNHFVNSGEDNRIRNIRIVYGSVPNGTPATLYIWSDPNEDGDPRDARVLASISTTVANADTDEFNVVSFPPVYIGPAGRNFFVGAIVSHASGFFPASLDQSSSAEQSWFCGNSGPIDPNNLGAAAVRLKLVDNYGYAGNWLIRVETGDSNCNGNLIPDECDIADGTSRDNNENGIPDECDCPGDLDGDWDIDLADLAMLLGNYGTAGGASYQMGDMDGDNDVDLADLAALLGQYGTSCD